MTRAITTPRLRSRRTPTLRVVSPTHTHLRHAAVVRIRGYLDQLVEVFTFDEMDGLAEAELVGTHFRHLLPGLGWLVIREPNGPTERADIIDVQEQAMEAIEATER